MAQNILVILLIIVAVAAGIGCWWYENFGSEKESSEEGEKKE